MNNSVRDNASLPLVLIGGTLCNSRLWTPVIERLNLSSVVCISLAGAETAQQAAMRLLKILPPRFALAGFSLGAIVALQIAADSPERLGGLALLSANPLADPPANAALRRDALTAAQEQGLRRWLSAALWLRYVAPSRLDDHALRDVICLMAEETGHQAFAQQTEIAIHRRDNRRALAALACPLAIINGAQDVICTPHHHQLLAASAPGATWTTVPGAGHFLPLETPDEAARPLLQWITECIKCERID